MIAEATNEISPLKLTPWILWAGGKRKLAARLVDEITALAPKRYVEPFLGGGAVALALPRELPKTLADINLHLIDCWLCVQKLPAELFAELKATEHHYGDEQGGYLAARDEFNSLIQHPRLMWPRRSALFIYLNARSFNGLWRTNGDGEFNVPFGKRKVPRSISRVEMMDYTEALKKCTILGTDFIDLFGSCSSMFRNGTAIFADCPYDEMFDGYAKGGFDGNDQRLLSDWLEVAAQQGAAVWATNADTPLIREIYRWAQIEEITEQHSVGPTAERRGKKGCLLIRGGAACR